MLIILDNNVLFQDPSLDKADATVIRETAEQLGYRIVLPEIVFDEAVQKRKEHIEVAINRLKRANRELKGNGIEQDQVTLLLPPVWWVRLSASMERGILFRPLLTASQQAMAIGR